MNEAARSEPGQGFPPSMHHSRFSFLHKEGRGFCFQWAWPSPVLVTHLLLFIGIIKALLFV